MIKCIEGNLKEIGSTTTQPKKDITKHLLLFHNISTKAKKRKMLKKINLFGCKNLIKHRPNFNGTSKYVG